MSEAMLHDHVPTALYDAADAVTCGTSGSGPSRAVPALK